MKEANISKLQPGTLPAHKFQLDPEKLGWLNRIGWQKYVRPDNTAFIMVDMQKDILSPQGAGAKFGGSAMWKALGALEKALKLIKTARRLKMKVYWVRGGYYGIGRDIPANSPQGERMIMLQKDSPGALTRNSRGYDIIDELRAVIEPQDIMMDKSASSSFVGTDLQQYLVWGGVKNIIICGCMTDVCVEGTARHGSDLGYYALVVADVSASNTWENQYHTLYHLSNIFATITTADQIADVLKRNSEK